MTGIDVSRRTVLGASGAGLAVMAAGIAAPAQAEPKAARPADRPNIVWFLSEDNNPYLGAYGDEVADTPTLDRLAAEGVKYEVMYSPPRSARPAGSPT